MSLIEIVVVIGIIAVLAMIICGCSSAYDVAQGKLIKVEVLDQSEGFYKLYFEDGSRELIKDPKKQHPLYLGKNQRIYGYSYANGLTTDIMDVKRVVCLENTEEKVYCIMSDSRTVIYLGSKEKHNFIWKPEFWELFEQD